MPASPPSRYEFLAWDAAPPGLLAAVRAALDRPEAIQIADHYRPDPTTEVGWAARQLGPHGPEFRTVTVTVRVPV